MPIICASDFILLRLRSDFFHSVIALQDEYLKAYYAAFFQRQQDEAAKRENELSNTDISNGVSANSDRQVGRKSKRDDNEGDEDIEWEEAPPTGRYQIIPCFQSLLIGCFHNSIWYRMGFVEVLLREIEEFRCKLLRPSNFFSPLCGYCCLLVMYFNSSF